MIIRLFYKTLVLYKMGSPKWGLALSTPQVPGSSFKNFTPGWFSVIQALVKVQWDYGLHVPGLSYEQKEQQHEQTDGPGCVYKADITSVFICIFICILYDFSLPLKPIKENAS